MTPVAFFTCSLTFSVRVLLAFSAGGSSIWRMSGSAGRSSSSSAERASENSVESGSHFESRRKTVFFPISSGSVTQGPFSRALLRSRIFMISAQVITSACTAPSFIVATA